MLDGHKLVTMGAVVSNNPNVAPSLNAVDGERTLDIPAVYLCDLDETACTAAFAVRIINIPDYAYNTSVYAVPYFIVEIDGVETIVYGDMQTNTYNGALSNG